MKNNPDDLQNFKAREGIAKPPRAQIRAFCVGFGFFATRLWPIGYVSLRKTKPTQKSSNLAHAASFATPSRFCTIFSEQIQRKLCANLYPNKLKNWNFDKEAPQISCQSRGAVFIDTPRDSDKKAEGKPTTSKINPSSCLGILLLREIHSQRHYQ
jgi:hypothetical protein